MSDEKNKPPTEKRLRDAHDEGESIKSQDLIVAGNLLFFALALTAGASFLGSRLNHLFQVVLAETAAPGENRLDGPLFELFSDFFLLVVPLSLAAMLGSVVAIVGQGGLTFSMKPIEPKFERINPVDGLGRVFSIRTVLESSTAFFKMLLLSTLLLFTARSLLPLLVNATARPPELLVDILLAALLRTLYIATVGFLVFGLIDFGIQRFLFIRDHRMSEDDIKREDKDENGNPEVKAKQREIAQEMLEEDPKAAVGSSNVVIANPTHVAVALRRKLGEVPCVVAKGLDDVALTLRAHAEALGIPVVVNPALARTLVRIPLGAPIPRHCYEAVAVLLRTIGQLSALQQRPRNEV